jgi:nonsense-mediated mRNA decay protein 3
VFCVECGKEGELIGSLCEECYSKKHLHASLPEHVDVIMCAHCSAVKTERGWEAIGSIKEAAELAVEQAITVSKDAKVTDLRIELSERDERNLVATVGVSITAHGREFQRALSTSIRLKRGACNECSKQMGSYYEAILQIRGHERALAEKDAREVERIVRARVESMRKSSRAVFLSRIDEVKGGLDFYFSTIPAARAIAKELQETLCAEYKESSSLWGRKDGKEVNRMTYLVRLPGFGRGDIVEHQNRDRYVRGMSKGVVHAVDLLSGEELMIKLAGSDDCSLSTPKSAVKKAAVVTESEREIQVVDPDTMATVEVRKPRGFLREGEQVRFVKTRLGAYVLSDGW